MLFVPVFAAKARFCLRLSALSSSSVLVVIWFATSLVYSVVVKGTTGFGCNKVNVSIVNSAKGSLCMDRLGDLEEVDGCCSGCSYWG